ncbi:hypothetical protein ACXXNA_04915 [Bordetella bronchiseptica]
MHIRSILLHHEGAWRLLADGQLTTQAGYPTLARPVVAVSDFGQATLGMTLLEGSPQHAAAVIEKKLRADGMIDQESRILVHHVKHFGKGYQALYTAVTLADWQNLTTWSGNQADHCPLVPLAALLWSAVGSGRGVMLRLGRQLIFMAQAKHRMLYASAITFSDQEEDLDTAVLNLAASIRDEVGDNPEDVERLLISWTVSLATDSLEMDERLARRFAEQSGLATRLAPAEALRDEAGRAVYSALPALVAAAPVRVAVNDNASKLMYLAERALPWASVASLTLAAVLSVQAGSWALKAGKAQQQALQETRDSEPLRAEIGRLAATRAMPEAYAAQRTFLERADALREQTDPVEVLNALRSASAGGIRILRVHVTTTRAQQAGAAGERLLAVDGVLDGSQGSTPGALLARFVGVLRENGYVATSVDPNAASASSQPPAGFFSYHLRQAPPVALARKQP